MINKKIENLERFLKENSTEGLRDVLDEAVNEVTNQEVSYKDIAEILIEYYEDGKDYEKNTIRDAIYYSLTDELEEPYYSELWGMIETTLKVFNEN